MTALCLISTARSAQTEQLINITTAHASLRLQTDAGGNLYQLGFGGMTNSALVKNPARETRFYPAYGDGYTYEPALQATHADGNTSTDLIYVKHTVTSAGTNILFTRIELRDSHYPFFVTLCFRAYQREDVIEAWTELRQEETGPVTLFRYASASLLQRRENYWLTQFNGEYFHEAQMTEERLTAGLKLLDSKLGVRASGNRIPSFLLSLNGPAQEEAGEIIGGSLEWSGSYQLAFEVDEKNRLHILAGINPFASQYQLKPGEIFTTPALLWTWSDAGAGQVSRNFHAWARKYGIRDGTKPRPVLLNNWEATYFKFNEGRLLPLLDGAKMLGCDIFLLDDGWFGHEFPRNNDHAGLGDWQVNRQKLPGGLSFLAEAASARGLGFGIWLEPEMVNPQSTLYHSHPDWVIRQPFRAPDLSRHQLDLDLSNPAVEQFVWNTIDSTFSVNTNIRYVKWDCNRFVTQPGSSWLKPAQQAELGIDYTRALYRVMGRMVEKYPQVMGMLCAGGPGRADYGALKYFDSFWTSDNTDPRDRVFIQWGFSHIFPASVVCAHITRSGHRPWKFTLDVALSGTLGLDLDLAKDSAEEDDALKNAIQLYKNDLRELTGQGDLYRLESPYAGPRACLDYVDSGKDRAVLFIYQIKTGQPSPMFPRGLDSGQRYQATEVNLSAGKKSHLQDADKIRDGAAWMREGLTSPCQNEFDSAVIEFNRVP